MTLTDAGTATSGKPSDTCSVVRNPAAIMDRRHTIRMGTAAPGAPIEPSEAEPVVDPSSDEHAQEPDSAEAPEPDVVTVRRDVFEAVRNHLEASGRTDAAALELLDGGVVVPEDEPARRVG